MVVESESACKQWAETSLLPRNTTLIPAWRTRIRLSVMGRRFDEMRRMDEVL